MLASLVVPLDRIITPSCMKNPNPHLDLNVICSYDGFRVVGRVELGWPWLTFSPHTPAATNQLLNIFYSVSHFTGSLYSSSDLNKIHLRHFNNKIRPPYFNPVTWFPWKQPRDPSPKTDSAAVHLHFNCGTSVSKKDINLNCSCSFSL